MTKYIGSILLIAISALPSCRKPEPANCDWNKTLKSLEEYSVALEITNLRIATLVDRVRTKGNHTSSSEELKELDDLGQELKSLESQKEETRDIAKSCSSGTEDHLEFVTFISLNGQIRIGQSVNHQLMKTLNKELGIMLGK